MKIAMARTTNKSAAPKGKDTSAHLGFEAKLWLSADIALRVSANPDCAATWRDLRAAQDHRSNNMDAAEYKHVVLGLIFFKYITEEARRDSHA